MNVSEEIKNNETLYNQLMYHSIQESNSTLVTSQNDKGRIFAAGLLQGIDIMFYLMQDLGMSNAALFAMVEKTKHYMSDIHYNVMNPYAKKK